MTKARSLEIVMDQSPGVLFMWTTTLQNYGAATIDGDITTVDAVMILGVNRAWLVTEDSRTTVFEPYEFQKASKSRRARFHWSVNGTPESTQEIKAVSVGYDALSVGDDDRDALDKGQCPAALLNTLKAAGLFSEPVDKSKPGPAVAIAPANAGPVERIRALNEAEKNKIAAATSKRAGENRAAAQALLVALRNTLTRQGKLDKAIAVKALGDDPDSDEARSHAPDEAVAILTPYDKAKASIEDDGAKAGEELKKHLLVALNAEQSAAMKRGDFDTTVALKKIIDAGGEFEATPGTSTATVQQSTPSNAPFAGLIGNNYIRDRSIWKIISDHEFREFLKYPTKGDFTMTYEAINSDGTLVFVGKPHGTTERWIIRLEPGKITRVNPNEGDWTLTTTRSPVAVKNDSDNTAFGRRVKPAEKTDAP